MPMIVVPVDLGPRQVARQTVLKASAEDIYDLIANPYLHREFDGSGTVRGTVSGPDRMFLGSTFTVTMHMFGLRYKITSTVTRAVPGVVLEWRHPRGHRWRYTFSPKTSGGTEITEIWDYRHANMPQLQEMTGFRGRNARGIELTLEGLHERFP